MADTMIPTLGLYITTLIESEGDYSGVTSRRVELLTENFPGLINAVSSPLLLTMSFISFADKSSYLACFLR